LHGQFRKSSFRAIPTPRTHSTIGCARPGIRLLSHMLRTNAVTLPHSMWPHVLLFMPTAVVQNEASTESRLLPIMSCSCKRVLHHQRPYRPSTSGSRCGNRIRQRLCSKRHHGGGLVRFTSRCFKPISLPILSNMFTLRHFSGITLEALTPATSITALHPKIGRLIMAQEFLNEKSSKIVNLMLFREPFGRQFHGQTCQLEAV
jgi:hypothetical protein